MSGNPSKGEGRGTGQGATTREAVRISQKAERSGIAAHIDAVAAQLHRIVSEGAVRNAPNAARELAEMRQRLRTYLDSEERAELLAKAVSESPELSDRADRILDQHEVLRTGIAEIVELADRAGGSVDAWASVETAFHHYADDVRLHERLEDELLRDAYWSDSGGG